MQVKSNSISLFFILVIFLVSCNNPKKINHETLSKTYVDIMIAQEIYLPNFDSLKIHKQKIFNKYGITEEDYFYTLESYKADTETWDKFFAASMNYLDTLRKQNIK
ncbi:MAG TPA: DUF4296 domain-containing protein [Melioribacteraceae bacterium]|nr:DUF4296 domain-containing protein [Melioribacteraceae bacterium]